MSSTEPSNSRNANKQRGKYTTKACEECRRRRVKCDGKKPSCSRCSIYSISCRYSDAEDGRRPAPKSYVLCLRERIASLERLLEHHGIDAGTGDSTLSSLENPGGPGANLEPDMSSTMDSLCESFQGELTLDGSLNFDQDGEMRYFGPTSGRLLFGDSFPADNGSCEGVNPAIFEPDPSLDDFNVYLEPNLIDDVVDRFGIPKYFQDNLIDLYFTWEQPWYPIVDEILFRESLSSGGRYWCALLHNSILALGSRFSDSPDVRLNPDDPNTAGRRFLEQAKVLLYPEMEHPSLTTIQALGVMGTVYIAMGADAAGWLHHGMANRLCLDMGLNLDPGKFEGTNRLVCREFRLRRQIYWTLYDHDKLSASYTGRICSMLDGQGAVNMPLEIDEFEDTRARTAKPIRRALTPLQRAMSTISQIQEKILLSLWSPKPLLKDHQRPAFLSSCLLDLKNWFYDLPHCLRIDSPNDVPQAYTLHMVYHTARILLAKPFLMTPRPNPEYTPEQAQNETLKIAQCASTESARAICLVAQKYRQVFGGFQRSPITATHCALSAALVLLCEPSCPSNRNRLSLCLTVLDELASSWCPAKHIGRNLRKLCASCSGEMALQLENNPLGGFDMDTKAFEPELELPHLYAGIDPNTQINTNTSPLFQWTDLSTDYEFSQMLNHIFEQEQQTNPNNP